LPIRKWLTKRFMHQELATSKIKSWLNNGKMHPSFQSCSWLVAVRRKMKVFQVLNKRYLIKCFIK
jgi:hypothetical protein